MLQSELPEPHPLLFDYRWREITPYEHTTGDSPLELLQENSDVHAPLGVQDGNLGGETDTDLDIISLSAGEIISLLFLYHGDVGFPNRQSVPKVKNSGRLIVLNNQGSDTFFVLHQ